MRVEFTWSKWCVLSTRQATLSGTDRWLTIGPVHFRWTVKKKLTARQQINNLRNALSEHDSDCAVHHDCGCDCGANEFARKFSVI